MIKLDPLFKIHAQLDDILDFGKSDAGHLRIVRILGGTFEGEKLSGKILNGGGDWQTLRDDGVMELEVRCLMQADNGALIHLTGQGMRHGPPEVMARMARGEAVAPDEYYFREFMRFKTSDKELAWLNGVFGLATGGREKNAVVLQVYAVN